MPRGLGNAPHPIEGVTPDASVRLPGLALQRQHVSDQRPVVAKAIDPCKAAKQEISLDPMPIFVVKVSELATIPVDTLTPEREPDRASQGQLRERCFRFVRKGLKLDACPAERQFGSLDPNEAYLTSVIEHQRVPVDDLGDLGRAA